MATVYFNYMQNLQRASLLVVLAMSQITPLLCILELQIKG
jgi:hypothetical protein